MRRIGFLALFWLLTGCAEFGGTLGDLGDLGLPAGAAAPTESEIADGLREALTVGSQRAAGLLGKADGYWGAERFRIPMPEMLDRAARYLRSAGQGQKVDEFHLALNRAAEKAAPEAAGVFADAVRQMTLADARAILQGPEDAATRYLQKSTRERLAQTFLPIVTNATGATGVTRQYKQLVAKAGPIGDYLAKDARDLDAYVTERALDGLFVALADEEKRIRRDPAARTTELLKKVFSR